MSANDRIAQEPTVLDPSRPASGAAERLSAGEAVGDYVIDRHLGAGAMGDVYAGRNPVIGKRVAIKVLKRELASRAEAAERFLREARAVNQVDHPNVVDVFALGRLDDGRLYLVMDLLDGDSLRARLAAGPLAADVTLALLGQVADALDAAHTRGVVHRDLKPDNIVITGAAAKPTAHVLDFGIAKLLADAGGERAIETLTGQGAWLGTPAYMAPEQWSADGATAASDRYALGIVAYELLTGKAPFRATTLPGMMEQHFRAAVPSVTSTGAALSPALDRVFARALAKEPAERYPTAAALVADLEAALGGRAPRAAPRRTPWLALGAAGLVVVAGGVVVIAGVGRERAPRAKPPSPPPAGVARVAVSTSPPGARVRRNGTAIGVTPIAIDAEPGESLRLELAKPGYATVVRTAIAAAGEPVEVAATLALVSGFEGVWALPDGGFRAFERRGDQVAGFRLDAARGPRQFLRFFAFVPADESGVAFGASEPHVDERAPDEPSCNIELEAEYHYDPATDALALRKQQARYALVDGRCVLEAIAWSEPKALARLAGAPEDATVAESSAGASNVQKPVKPKPRPKPPIQKKLPPSKEDLLAPPPAANAPNREALQEQGQAQQRAAPGKKD